MPENEQEIDIRQRIREEFKKCAQDPIYFIKKFCVIQHPKRGKIPFALYPFQEKAILEIMKHRYNICAKGRQLGMSTVAAAYILWKMMFNNDYKVLILATTQETAKELLYKIQLMYELLPSWLRSSVPQDRDNKTQLLFKNGSSCRAVSSNEKSARSPSLSLLVCDEAAFIENFDVIWSAAQATLSTGGDCLMLSSANGVANIFYDLWDKAINGDVLDTDENPFNPIFLPWNVHPERDQKWADNEKAKIGARMFAQEHSVEFLTSGHTVISGEVLQKYKDLKIKEPIEKRYGGMFWIWERPKYGKEHLMTVDISRGDGSDFSTFHIYEIESLTHCASFKGKIDTREFANIIIAAATEYNMALVAPENHSMGWDVVQTLVDRYPNLYYTYKNDPYFDENIHIKKNLDLIDKSEMTPGFTSSTRTRFNLVSKLDMYFNNDPTLSFDMKCSRTWSELATFMWINGKPQAAAGKNDDLVIPLGMILYLKDTVIRMRQHGIEMTKRAFTNSYKSVYKPEYRNNRQWTMNTGHSDESIEWLLGRRKNT